MREVKGPLLVVGIMGAGSMAQGFDAPADGRVLTLAHAVKSAAGFRLGGFFDIDSGRTAAAERKWGCPESPRDRAVWLNQPWDVVCIATPDAEHAADLRDVLARKPKAIVVEKPVATEPEEALGALHEAQRLGVAVLVDFPRRWHSAVAAVAEYVKDGRLGRPLAAAFVYSGEAVHSAVHMLDLFHTWWGGGWEPALETSSTPITVVTMRRADHAVTMSFINVPSEPSYVWEMHVYCERGKVELSRSPEILEVSVPRPHPVYTGHQVLTPLARFDMEEEPLLVRLVDTLRDAVASPDLSRALVQREIDSQIFSGGVLRCLGGLPCQF